MLRFVLLAAMAASTINVRGQIKFSRYFQQSMMPSIDNDTHPALDFSWNMSGKIQTLMNNGITELEEGDPAVALRDFDEVIKITPSFMPAFYYRGIVYKKEYDFASAEKDLQKFLKANPGSGEALLMLGEIYQQQSKIELAEIQYEKAVSFKPGLVRGYYNLGTIELVKSNVRKATRYFEKCHEVDPRFADAYLMQGLVKYREFSKDNIGAMLYFNQALQQDSTHRETLFWRGLSYIQLEQPEKGIQDWDKLVLYNPNIPFFLMMRGFLNVELNNFDQAYNDLRKSVLSNRENEEHFRRGETLLDKRIDIQYATEYAMRFSYGLDEGALAHFKKGFCFFLSDKRELALESFTAAARLQPSATVFFLKALTFEHDLLHDSAFYYYDKALALDNEIIDAHKKRAIYRYEAKDWKGAYADLKEMTRLQPDLMLTYRLRGLIKVAQKDYYGAIIDFSKYLKSDSTDYEIWQQRAYCRSTIKDERGANEDFRIALRYNRLNWEVFEHVVNSYLTILHDTTNALATLKEYNDAYPEKISPWMQQAELYLCRQQWDSTRYAIDKAIKRFHPVFYDKTQYSEALVIRGLSAFGLQDYTSSIAEFGKALDMDPGNLKARYNRGKAYLKTGEKKKAIADFKKLQKAGYADSDVILQSLSGKT